LQKSFTPLAIGFLQQGSPDPSTLELFLVLAEVYGNLPALPLKHDNLMDGGRVNLAAFHLCRKSCCILISASAG